MSELGHELSSQCSAYSMLVASYEQDLSHKVGNSLVSTLKGIFEGQNTSIGSQGEQVKQINKLLPQVQFRKRLGWVKREGAVFL